MTDAVSMTKGELDITVWKLKAIAKQLREHYTDRIELREQMAGDAERAAKMLERVPASPEVAALIVPIGTAYTTIDEFLKDPACAYGQMQAGKKVVITGREGSIQAILHPGLGAYG